MKSTRTATKVIDFEAVIQKYGANGEKTGWTYVFISSVRAHQLNPGCRVSFRVKGKIDGMPVAQQALLPVGEGDFILVMNAAMRKRIGKGEGDSVRVHLQLDQSEVKLSADFITCLKDEPRALTFFDQLPRSHQQYFSKWIESAKTIQTKTKRITAAVMALSEGRGFAEMIRAGKTRN